jgi:hypothetical protein
MADVGTPSTRRDENWRGNREALVPVLQQAQSLIAMRIGHHGKATCACPWCSFDRAVEKVLRYCPGGDLYV